MCVCFLGFFSVYVIVLTKIDTIVSIEIWEDIKIDWSVVSSLGRESMCT